MESWDTEDIPDTESEDEACGIERRRRTAVAPMDSTTPPTARRETRPEQRGPTHALFDPSL